MQERFYNTGIGSSMKIIKPGKLFDVKTFNANCYNCGCVFEFEEDDAKFNIDKKNGDYFTVFCPFCGKNVYFQP